MKNPRGRTPLAPFGELPALGLCLAQFCGGEHYQKGIQLRITGLVHLIASRTADFIEIVQRLFICSPPKNSTDISTAQPRARHTV